MTSAVYPAGTIRRLAAARMASVGGGAAAYAAIVFQVLEKTGDTFAVVAVMLATTGLQSIVLPFAGKWADHLGRRRVMIVSDVVAAAIFVVLARDLSATQLVVLAGLAAIAEAPFLPASAAAVPDIVAGEHISRANGTLSSATSLGRTAGPVLAIPLLALDGPQLVYLCNAVTFLISAALVFSVTISPPSREPGSPIGMRSAARFIRATPAVYLILISSLTAYISTSFAMVAEPILADDFDVGVIGYNLMGAGWGLGLVLGGWFGGRNLKSATEPRALLLGRVVMGVGIATVPLAPWFSAVPALMMVGGFGSGVVLVAMHSQLQRHSPERIRSTVFAFFEAVGASAFVFGVLLAGVAVEGLGLRPAYLLAGVGTLLTAIPLYLNLRRSAAARESGV
ncbi:MFS transporter [Jidongwangia harbinensis]|uniref:MFS transporter n=1 Tax=Jidongwangia harbinensis TaxID=2878561 RepID=UPI001CDA1CA5|nr:MFS transporter [Jidongwangia harbinensis]MCA2213214.1 MFS transporter [Jidongwangia harbinensis]